MDENVRKLRVGIFVLMAMVILGILILVNSEGWVPQYDVYVKPERAPGVTVGTPVRKNGILIGRVKEVRTNDEDGLVILRLGINRDNNIYENEICSIGTETFFGDAVIEFLPLSKEQRGAPIVNEHTMSKVAIERDPLEVMTSFADLKPQLSEALASISDAGIAVQDAGANVGELTTTLKSTLQDEDSQFNMMVADFRLSNEKAQAALDNFNEMFANINEVLDDPELQRQFRDSLATMPKIFEEVRITIADTRAAINKFGTIPDNVNATLGDLKTFSTSLKDEGPKILQQVNQNLQSLDKFVGELKGVGKTLEKFKDADGTLVKLMKDDELYQSIRSTINNINDVSVKLKPLMDDVRLFADGIARDPGQLGVRGAFDRRPAKSGYKGSAGLR